METTGPDTAITDDVLHIGSPTKLSDEEIAKAVAHHNRHHAKDKPESSVVEITSGKNQQTRKPGK